MWETEIKREEWQREIDEWKENREEVAETEERHTGIYVDAHSYLVPEHTAPVPILVLNLPVAVPSCAFSGPVLAFSWEPRQLLYAGVPTISAAQSCLFQVACDHRVGGFNRKRCIGCSPSEPNICGSYF